VSEDRDELQHDLDEQAVWGEGFQDRALRKVLAWIDKTRDRLTALEGDRDAARDAIVALRARVKALEDKVP